MDHFNAIRSTVTVGGTGNLTVSATGAGKGRPLSTLTSGWTGGLRFDDPNGVDWELSLCTMLTTTTLSRDTLLCSSTGSKVNFAVGTIVLQTVVAEQLNAMLSASDIPFAASIPLTRVGPAYMAAKTVSTPLTLTPGTSSVRGALVYLRCIADGVNLPDYSAFKEWGGSSGYDNRNGIENQMQFFFDGFNYFVSISQALGAVPVPAAASGVSLTGPTAGVVNAASTAFTVGVTPVGGAITGTVIVTPSDGGAGGTFSPVSASLLSGTSSATFTYLPTSTGAKTISVTNNGGLTSPSAIIYTVSASATAPATMAAPVATAGDTTASVAMTAPSNGGSAITGYTVTSSPAGMVDSNAGSTTLTHTMTGGTNGTAYTFTARATNAIGTSAASPASNSVTLASSTFVPAQYPRIASPQTGESGTGPYAYTADSAPYYHGLTLPTLPGDGYFIVRQEEFKRIAIGLHNTTPPANSDYSQQPPFIMYAVWTGTGNYVPSTNYVNNTATNTVAMNNTGIKANGDWVRFSRSGTTIVCDVSKNQGSTWTVVYTWTGITGTLYPNIGSNMTFTLIGGQGLV